MVQKREKEKPITGSNGVVVTLTASERKRIEENILIEKAKNGDEASLLILLEKYKGLIIKLTNKYCKTIKVTGIEFSDLLIEAQLGFLKAIEKFDTTKGFRLSTFATYCIRNYILNAIRTQGCMIKLSSREVNKRIKLSRENDKSNNNLLEDAFNKYNVQLIDNETYIDGFTDKQIDVSAETVTIGNETTNRRKQIINDCLKILTKNEVNVIKHFFGLYGCERSSLNKIAESMSTSYEAIRKTRASAITKLQAYFTDKGINLEDIIDQGGE